MIPLTKTLANSKTPVGVRLVAGYWALMGLLTLVGTVSILLGLSAQTGSISGAIVLLTQLPLLIIATICLLSAYYLMKLSRFGWWGALALAIFGLYISAVSFPDPSVRTSPVIWGELLVWIVSPIYLIINRRLFA